MDIAKGVESLNTGRVVPRGFAAVRFEIPGHRQFRDCMVFYYDGRARFERYCYGEAAGLVFGVWLESIASSGVITYRQPFDIAVKPEALPKAITAVLDSETLQMDGKESFWKVAQRLTCDKENGYPRIMVMVMSHFRKL